MLDVYDIIIKEILTNDAERNRLSSDLAHSILRIVIVQVATNESRKKQVHKNISKATEM